MPSVKNYPSSEVNQYELSSRLLSLTEHDTSYTLTQINGQRVFRKAPHAWNGPEPSRNCEVFIGRIPHDCFEDTLVPLFRQVGELFEFRLMINFSGWNRGYAFAMYATEAEANNAIRMFNNYMIRPSWQLGVCPSINNCRIFISRIPSSTPSAEIVRLLYALTDEVQEVRIRRGGSSCAAIVEYRSHRGAAMARKALVSAAVATWGCGTRPAVDWSLPQSPHLMRQYREIGRWTPERGVEIYRLPEEPASSAPASYTLERWSQARRMRMINEAQRAHANMSPAHAASAHLTSAHAASAHLTFAYAASAPVTSAHMHSAAPAHVPEVHTDPHAHMPSAHNGQYAHVAPLAPVAQNAANDWSGSSLILESSPNSPAGSWGTWNPWSSESEALDVPPYNPWTTPHPLHHFTDKPE